jgi:hypothetical protein
MAFSHLQRDVAALQAVVAQHEQQQQAVMNFTSVIQDDLKLLRTLLRSKLLCHNELQQTIARIDADQERIQAQLHDLSVKQSSQNESLQQAERSSSSDCTDHISEIREQILDVRVSLNADQHVLRKNIMQLQECLRMLEMPCRHAGDDLGEDVVARMSDNILGKLDASVADFRQEFASRLGKLESAVDCLQSSGSLHAATCQDTAQANDEGKSSGACQLQMCIESQVKIESQLKMCIEWLWAGPDGAPSSDACPASFASRIAAIEGQQHISQESQALLEARATAVERQLKTCLDHVRNVGAFLKVVDQERSESHDMFENESHSELTVDLGGDQQVAARSDFPVDSLIEQAHQQASQVSSMMQTEKQSSPPLSARTYGHIPLSARSLPGHLSKASSGTIPARVAPQHGIGVSALALGAQGPVLKKMHASMSCIVPGVSPNRIRPNPAPSHPPSARGRGIAEEAFLSSSSPNILETRGSCPLNQRMSTATGGLGMSSSVLVSGAAGATTASFCQAIDRLAGHPGNILTRSPSAAELQALARHSRTSNRRDRLNNP